MKSRVKVDKKSFYVDQEEGVVVCVLECNMQLNKHSMEAYLVQCLDSNHALNVTWDGKFKVKAVAKCSKDDTFNLELGKRLAESKAKLKAFNLAAKAYQLAAESLIKDTELVINSMGACKFASNTEEAHIEHLISQV